MIIDVRVCCQRESVNSEVFSLVTADDTVYRLCAMNDGIVLCWSVAVIGAVSEHILCECWLKINEIS